MCSGTDSISGYAENDVATLTDSALGEQITGIERAVARLQAEQLRRLEVFDRRGAARSEITTTAGWLRRHCNLSPGAARERVDMARRLASDLPAAAAALAEGDISYRHAAAITTGVRGLPTGVVSGADATLTRAARALDPPALRRLAEHLRYTVDPDAALADANAAHERRHLHVSETFDGLVAIDGMLDREGGATVLAALNAQPPPDADDRRTPAQRRADALVELARRQLDAGMPEVGGERPHVSVIVELSALRRVTGAKAASLEWGGPITGEAARRLACDAGVTRVITAGESEPLDVGRRTRTVPPAMRRALGIRDGGCCVPGCDRPPPWTDAHHIRHWAEGGPTSMDNLVLLCRRHHRLVHELDWKIFRRADGRFTAAPPGTGPPRSPRSPQEHDPNIAMITKLPRQDSNL